MKIATGLFKGIENDVWYFLTGDVNRLDYRATYARFCKSSVEIKRLDNWNEHESEPKLKYLVNEYCFDTEDLASTEKTNNALSCLDLNYGDLPLNDDGSLTIAAISMLIDAFVSYGYGAGENESGNNAKQLLSFDPWIKRTL